MKPTLPSWMFLGGIAALGLSNSLKDAFPTTLGRILPLHWGCSIVSAILFSVGLFLSLYGLFTQIENRRRFAMAALINLSLLVMLLCLYFGAYVMSTRLYDLAAYSPDFLPKLVAGSQSALTEKKRLESAEVAYKLYGVELVYRRDAGDLVAYVPTQSDIESRKEHVQSDAQTQQSLATLKGAFDQWPYLFGFDMGALFLTFLIGSIWVASRPVRVPTSSHP